MPEKHDRPPPPADFDENPEWTEEFFRRARPAAEVMGPAFMEKVRRKPGRPAVEAPKAPVTLRLDAEILQRLRASGRGWQTRLASKVAELVRAGDL
ncbi:MAG: BrnA antitoxin family protein [Phenylobacterium sp.]|uniref:BrnA antitoxin family protein n=1 Tax=Phenylobacterium sp. TaxID=1871053 RepID=UPI001A536AAD|nr:BrnA antitoxin family protein [Phenylobacterium sp.]MBL8554903.1 BrnA antitoxin family protein [Phenylobacterium sp.]